MPSIWMASNIPTRQEDVFLATFDATLTSTFANFIGGKNLPPEKSQNVRFASKGDFKILVAFCFLRKLFPQVKL